MGEDNYPKAGTLEHSTGAECPRHRAVAQVLKTCGMLRPAQEPSSTQISQSPNLGSQSTKLTKSYVNIT